MSLVLLTNVVEYTGAGSRSALVDDGRDVVCHDHSFSDRNKRAKFAELNPRAHVLAGQSPEAIYEETTARWGTPDAIVLNDAYPITRNEIGATPSRQTTCTARRIIQRHGSSIARRVGS